MKLLLSLALVFVAVDPAQAQCTTEFCPGGITLEGGEVDLDGTIFTCSELSASWSSIIATPNLTTQECAGLTILAGVNCCPTKQYPATCFLCNSAEAIFNANKALPDSEVPVCGIIDALFSYAEIEANCTAGKAEFDQSFNLASYCECSDVPAPDLCKVCDDNQIVNTKTRALVPDGDGLTCIEGFEYARHVANQTVCDRIETNESKAACCVVEAFSSGISLSMKTLVAALFLGVMCAI
ncbi:unnamed protein product [Cylindrotheca closterium]|uniref:Uncharacterized protein n=1 Tax=Cylindrotheca closterium TaxID=2856 RepID=A0AAD2CH05_9STRA|nr:unnamed protein product [Cylindrotheca closterium]